MQMRPRASGPRVGGAVALALAVAVAGCTYERSPGDAQVIVFAAASLSDAFTEIAEAFEAERGGTEVQLNFGASSALREQILAGAPADVFASADPSNVDAVVDAGLAADPVPFATNRLSIAVPAGNPGGVTGLADLANEALFVGLCAQEAPCGRLARQALAAAGVAPSLDTEAPDVRALLTQLESGDLDVGIVYETDVRAAGGRVEAIPLPADAAVLAEYPILLLGGGGTGGEPDATDAARAFVEFVLSPEGAAILETHGFGPP